MRRSRLRDTMCEEGKTLARLCTSCFGNWRMLTSSQVILVAALQACAWAASRRSLARCPSWGQVEQL
eukprot:7047405-Pyramimonas_sp.AAC.1